MLKKFTWSVFFLLFSVLMVYGAPAGPASSPGSDPSSASAVRFPKFALGFAERIRLEFRKNITDLESGRKDNREYFKIKTQVWFQEDLNKDSDLYIRFVNENKPYMYWAGASAAQGKSATKKGFRYEVDEVVFDNVYADIRDLAGLPLDMRLGRQDFKGEYGEGFLISDGTPGDGSRTFYFNAAKISWRVDEKNKIDFIYAKSYRSDNVFPVLNRLNPEQQLNSSDGAGYILYHKNDAIKGLHIEDFYIYKKEEVSESASARMTKKKTTLNTFGSFAQYKFAPWTLKGQFACQLGSYGNNRRIGLGGYGYLDRDLKKWFWSPTLSLGFILLSGDDQSTSANEAWDPLYSRVTPPSDLYSYIYGSETELTYWTNLQMYRIGYILNPTKKTKLTLRYNFLRANEGSSPALSAAIFSGTGLNRGHLFQTKLEYKVSKNVTAGLMGEYFVPGNFYVRSSDEAMFFQGEFQVSF